MPARTAGTGREDHPLDETEIREFLAREYPQLVAGLAMIAGSRALAEDAVQEALARAWERAERGERIDSLRAWTTTVALNLLRSGFRRLLVERRVRERLKQDAGGSVLAEADAREASEWAADLRKALADLPRRQREATVLRYYLDMDVKEIAKALRIREGTAKTTLHRARLALAEALGEPELEEEGSHAGH